MDSIFEKARRLAVQLNDNTRGMASVGVSWHPYENKWEGFADWSNNTRLRGEYSDSPTDAMCLLIDRLQDEISEAVDAIHASR